MFTVTLLLVFILYACSLSLLLQDWYVAVMPCFSWVCHERFFVLWGLYSVSIILSLWSLFDHLYPIVSHTLCCSTQGFPRYTIESEWTEDRRFSDLRNDDFDDIGRVSDRLIPNWDKSLWTVFFRSRIFLLMIVMALPEALRLTIQVSTDKSSVKRPIIPGIIVMRSRGTWNTKRSCSRKLIQIRRAGEWAGEVVEVVPEDIPCILSKGA